MSAPILEVTDLRTHVFTRAGVVKAVDGVSLEVGRGEIVGLVGESGSGKSLTGFSLLGLVDPPGRIVSGSIRLDGEEMVGRSPAELRALRGARIAMVFQDPMATLNPVLKIGTQMRLALAAHFAQGRGRARRRRADPRRHPRRQGPPLGLPARVLGRHETARRRRDRAFARLAGADRR